MLIIEFCRIRSYLKKEREYRSGYEQTYEWSRLAAGALALSLLSGYGAEKAAPAAESKTVTLDPSNPISLTVWHYYNGAQQSAFDELASEFNATVGKEKGIYVEGCSQGSVSDLEKAVTAAAAGSVGS